MPDTQEEPEDLQECRTLENIRFVKIGRGHFRVFSRSQPETAYDVDLHTYGGLGSCTCPDFTARRKPRWRGVRKNYDCFRCVHLRAMRNVTLDAIIAFYAKREQQQQ
jgi:hypothetical protein